MKIRHPQVVEKSGRDVQSARKDFLLTTTTFTAIRGLSKSDTVQKRKSITKLHSLHSYVCIFGYINICKQSQEFF